MCKDKAADFKSFANHLLNLDMDQASSQNNSPSSSSSSNPFSFFQNIFTSANQPENKNNTWTLRLPIHARRVFFSQVQNNRLLNPILLNESDLEQRRVFEKPMAKKDSESLCEFDDQEQHFILLINMTDQIAQNHSHAWYVICAEFNALEDGAAKDDASKPMTMSGDGSMTKKRDANNSTSSSGCSRCTLFKSSPSSEAGQLRFLQHVWLRNQPLASDRTTKGNVLEYTVADMPFPSARISGTVTDDCSSNFTEFHFNRLIKPNQVIYINLPSDGLVGNYAVKVDVLPEDENGGNFFVEDMKLPLILTDYLHEDN